MVSLAILLTRLENTSNLKITSPEPNRRYTPEQKPHALCLTVCLSNASFIKTKAKRSDGSYASDIKLDVFFNGQFCASDYIPRRYCGDTKYGMTEHIIRFTGQRLGRIVEKPWVLVPPDQGPDGIKRSATNNVDATQRWEMVSNALLDEAETAGRNENGERSIIGEYLESLASLPMPQEADSMQQDGHANFGVIDIVITYGQGSKDAPEASYLFKPTPMRIESYKPVSKKQPAAETPFSRIAPIPEDETPVHSPPKMPRTRSEALATAKGLDAPEDSTPEPLKEATTPPNQITRSQALSNGTHVSVSASPVKPMQPPPARKQSASPIKPVLPPLVPKRRRGLSTSTLISVKLPQRRSKVSSTVFSSSIEPPPKRLRTPSASPAPPVKPSLPRAQIPSTSTTTSITIPISPPPKRVRWPAMPYQHVWTTKQTLAEEMDSIATQAAEDTQAGFEPLQTSIPRATRASFGNFDEAEIEAAKQGNSPLSSALPDNSPPKSVSKMSKIVTLRYSSPLKSGSLSPVKADANTPMDKSGSSSPIKPPTTTPTDPPPTMKRRTINSAGHSASDEALTPVQASFQKRRRNKTESKQPSAEVLEAGFLVSELSQDCVVTYAEKGVLRNVSAVRGGKFVEVGVLMGVRFLVG